MTNDELHSLIGTLTVAVATGQKVSVPAATVLEIHANGAAEIERLRAESAELAAVRMALGGDAYWMDPPDGGNVTLAEMVARANDAGRQADRLGRELALIRDIATGSTTANSLPNIARIANAALLAKEGA